MAESFHEKEPNLFHETINCYEASQWIGAMKELELLTRIKIGNLLRNPLLKRLWIASVYLRKKME